MLVSQISALQFIFCFEGTGQSAKCRISWCYFLLRFGDSLVPTVLLNLITLIVKPGGHFCTERVSNCQIISFYAMKLSFSSGTIILSTYAVIMCLSSLSRLATYSQPLVGVGGRGVCVFFCPIPTRGSHLGSCDLSDIKLEP